MWRNMVVQDGDEGRSFAELSKQREVKRTDRSE